MNIDEILEDVEVNVLTDQTDLLEAELAEELEGLDALAEDSELEVELEALLESTVEEILTEEAVADPVADPVEEAVADDFDLDKLIEELEDESPKIIAEEIDVLDDISGLLADLEA